MAKPKKNTKRATEVISPPRLTGAQQKTIDILSRAETVWGDGLKLAITGGYCTHTIFKTKWMLDPVFVEELNAARERVKGELPDRVKNMALAEAERLFATMIDIGRGEITAKKGQVEAITYVLDRAGIDTHGTQKRSNLFVLIQQRIEQQAAAPSMKVAEQDDEDPSAPRGPMK